MPVVAPGETSNALDRNAVSADRVRRNFQRMTQGAIGPLVPVDGTTITRDPTTGALTLKHPLVINDTVIETPDGVRTTFTLHQVPAAGTLMLFVNGVEQVAGANNDFTLSGSTITFNSVSIPQTGDVLRATYEE